MRGIRLLRLGSAIGLGIAAGVIGCSRQPLGTPPLVAGIEPAVAATRPTVRRTTPEAEYQQLLLVYGDLSASARVVGACGVRDAGWSQLIAARLAAATAADERLAVLRATLTPAQVAAITAAVDRDAAASARAVAGDRFGTCRDIAVQPYVRRLDAVAYGTLDARDFYD